jgi:predicted DNA-binding protein (UPF0251 family)
MSTVETVSPDEIESTRMLGARNRAEILQTVARVTQAHAADCMGVSASTVSRALEDQLDRWSLMLAALGLQVVPMGSMVVDQHELTALEGMALKYLETRRQQRAQEDRRA